MNENEALNRVLEIITQVDCGKLTDEQGIKKIMKAITKYHQSKFKKKEMGK